MKSVRTGDSRDGCTLSTWLEWFRVKGGRPPMTVWTGLYPRPSRSAGRAERFTYGKLNLMLPLPSTARISPPGRKMFTTTASYLAREGKAPLNAPWHSQWTRPVCGRPILVPGIHRRPIPTKPCFRPSWPFPNTGSPSPISNVLTLRVSRIHHPPLPSSPPHFLTLSFTHNPFSLAWHPTTIRFGSSIHVGTRLNT